MGGCLGKGPAESKDEVGELKPKRVRLESNQTAKSSAQVSTKNVLQAANDDETSGGSKLVKGATMKNKLTRFLLKFPKIRTGYHRLFLNLKHDYENIEPKKGLALESSKETIKEALKESGLTVPDADVDKAFPGDSLTFRKVLEGIQKLFRECKTMEVDKDNPSATKIQTAFKIVSDMFSIIDDDDSGEITLDEFKVGFAGLG